MFRKSDFTDPKIQLQMSQAGDEIGFDVVLSDMAPNATGSGSHDAASIFRLSLAAMRFALLHTRPGGHFVAKLYDGKERATFSDQAARFYDQIDLCKPEASRSESSEIYIVARHFKGLQKK